MPVYNAEEYLREAIDSILTQTLADLELLVINDGSTDGSEAIVLSYQDPRIRYLHNGTNQGVVYSRNRGLELARGEYIASMDADDISLPERLEKQVLYLDAHGHIGACGSSFELSSGQIRQVPSSSKTLITSLAAGNCFAASTVMMRRRLLLDHGLRYQQEYMYSEDYDLWLQIAKHADLGAIPEVLLYYRVHQVSITHAFNTRQRIAAHHIRANWYEWVLGRPVTGEERVFLQDDYSEVRVVKSGWQLIEAVGNSKNARIDPKYYLTTTASRYEYLLITQYKKVPLLTLLYLLFFSPLRKYSTTGPLTLVKMLVKQAMV